jgi:hypothetical protein
MAFFFSRESNKCVEDKSDDADGGAAPETPRDKTSSHTRGSHGNSTGRDHSFDLDWDEAEKIKKGLEKRIESSREEEPEKREPGEVLEVLREIRDSLKG